MLKGIKFSALKLFGCMIGISLLVPIEGPQILIPALVPKYGFPELMASFKELIKSLSINVLRSKKELPPPINIPSLSFIAFFKSLYLCIPLSLIPNLIKKSEANFVYFS